MKRYVQRNRILLLIPLAALVVGLAVIVGRWRTEARNKTYDVVLDYGELELLAEQSDHDVAWWLEQFRDMGITQVGLVEEDLTTLMEKGYMDVTADVMDTVIKDHERMDSLPASFKADMKRFGYDRFDVLVEANGQEAMDFILPAIRQRFPEGSFCQYSAGDKAYILLDGGVNDALIRSSYRYVSTKDEDIDTKKDMEASILMYVSLGFLPEKVETIQSLGMDIVPRSLGYNGHNGSQYARAVVADYERYGIRPTYMIAGGQAAIGNDDGEDTFVLDYIRDNDITIGLIETSVQRENITQSGVEDIVKKTGYDVVRVFSVWDYIQYRYQYYGYEGTEEIENTLYRAVVERNIRIIYFKPIKESDNSYAYITDVNIYRDLFERLDQRLSAHSISRGRASVMDDHQIPHLALLPLGLGAGVGGVLLLETVLPLKRKWTLLLALAAAVCVAGGWAVMPNTFRLVASFTSAVVFVCFSVAFFLRSAKLAGKRSSRGARLSSILPQAIRILVGSVLIALAAGIMTAAPLSSTDYMLEMGIFRGVKAAQLLSLAYFCVLFLACYGLFEKDRRANTLRMKDVLAALRWTIPVWALIIAGVVFVVGRYYIDRTGHETTAAVSTAEMIFRNDLENLLLARPRTKEFLVGFPCIMLAVYCAVRRLPFWTALFGLAGTIGLASVCNTFMHIRTPLYLGFFRTACSLVLGIVLGVLFTVCFELLYRVWLRLYDHFKFDEL